MAYRSPQARKESLAAARRLTDSLATGWKPDPIAVQFHLQPGEICYGQASAGVWQFLEGDGGYVHKSRMGFGMLGAAMVVGTAVGNSARKRRAGREAAPQFREIDQGQMYLTNLRFAVQGKMQWTDLWHQSTSMSTCDGEAITLNITNSPPVKLTAWPIDYLFALYRFVAHNEILQVPPDPA